MKRLIAFFMLMGLLSSSVYAMGEQAKLEECTDSVQSNRGLERVVQSESSAEEVKTNDDKGEVSGK